MFKNSYRKEMDNISASEKFKKDTISLMNQKQAELQQNNTNNNTIKFPSKKYGRIAASVAIVTLSLLAFPLFASEFSLGVDSAEGGRNPNANMEQYVDNESVTKDKDGEYDNLPANAVANKAEMRVYTINDAVAVSEIPESDKKKTKIIFNTESDSNYGFEGFLYYDISELDTKNGFDENIAIDTLPVYTFSSMDNEDIKTEFNRILDATGMTENDIIRTKFEWIELMQDGDRKVISNTLYTDTPHKPTERCQLYWINVELTEGYIEIKPQRSEIDVFLYDDLPEDDRLIGSYAAKNYTHILGNNLKSYVYSDYNIYGEQHHSPHYVFNNTDNYAQYIFNSTAGATYVWHLDTLMWSEHDKGENIHFQYTADGAYTPAGELTAITWQEALNMFYNGQYLSTVPQQIPTDTVVSKIELVYKEPPYYPPADYQSGYALPFYKFYVELPSMTFETDKGTLKNYGVYYVCAIHPDYVEYTDGYVKFN
ncbi:MAG: hypothetical protein IKY30_02245 [Oscillospiraceae bacterium]|nr:hypothetical protein [Oscillospiraceae bacterium]